MSHQHFVIQCGRCKFIVADSSLPYNYNQELGTILFDSGAKTMTQLSSLLNSKLNGVSVIHNNIACSECSKIIGKYYVEVPQIYTHIKNKIVISTNEILFYVLGMGKIDIDTFFNSNNINDDDIHDRNEIENDKIDSLRDPNPFIIVNQEIDKIQIVLMNVLERLYVLENSKNITSTKFNEQNDDNDNDERVEESSSKRRRN